MLRLVHVLPFEQARLRSAEQCRPGARADEVAGLRPGDCCHRAADEHYRQIEVDVLRMGGTDQAGEDEQGVAGQKKADEQPGFGEYDGQEAERSERLDELFGIHGSATVTGLPCLTLSASPVKPR